MHPDRFSAVVLLFGCLMPAQSSVAQPVTRNGIHTNVALVVTSDTDARSLLGPVVTEVRAQLAMSNMIAQIDPITHERWISIQQRGSEEYFQRYSIQYIVRLNLERLEAQRIRYTFTLIDRNRPRRPLYSATEVVRSDPEMFRPMLQKIGADLRFAIEGRPPRPMIFTYCFTAQVSVGELSRLAESLPIDLRQQMSTLRTIQQAYDVVSFSSYGVGATECRNPTGENVAYSDYVIYGYLVETASGLQVSVLVRRRGRDLAPLEKFAASGSRALAPQLATHILRYWSRVR